MNSISALSCYSSVPVTSSTFVSLVTNKLTTFSMLFSHYPILQSVPSVGKGIHLSVNLCEFIICFWYSCF